MLTFKLQRRPCPWPCQFANPSYEVLDKNYLHMMTEAWLTSTQLNLSLWYQSSDLSLV